MELSIVFSVLALLFWAFSFLYFRHYLKKHTARESILTELRNEVQMLVSEIDSVTDRDIALIEDRIKVLRKILEEADKRIASHNREIERSIAQERAYAQLGKIKAPAMEQKHVKTAPDELPFESPAKNAEPKHKKPEKKETENNGLPVFIRSENPIQAKPPSFTERVAELSQAGFSSDLIAKRLKSTVSEVDLAIALHSRRDSEE